MILRKDEFAASIETKIRELDAVLLKYNPFDVIANVSLANSILDAETYKEYKHEGREAFAEYIALLFLTHPTEELAWSSMELVDGQVLHDLQGKVAEVFRNTIWYFAVAGLKGEDTPDTNDELRFKTLTNSLIVRYSAYKNHLHDILRGIFRPVENQLFSVLGFDINDAIALSDAVGQLVTKRLRARSDKARDEISRLEKAVRKYRRKKEGTRGISNQTIQQFAKILPKDEKGVLKNLGVAWVFFGLGETLTFSAAELAAEANVSADRSQAFLEKLCLQFGAVDSRYRNPAPTHPLTTRPFIRKDGLFFCPLPTMVDWSIRPRIEELLKPSSADRLSSDHKYWHLYESARSKFLEESAVGLLSNALRHARFQKSKISGSQ